MRFANTEDLNMRTMFGDTKADKEIVAQIQNILIAVDADKDCEATLRKVGDLFKTLTSEDARKEAMALIVNFKDKNCKFDIVKFLTSPPGMALIGVVVIVVLLSR